MTENRGRLRRGQWLGVALGVLAVSIGHYETSMHALVLHEVFTRLYYLPIVFAALVGGIGAGLTAALLASALYLPHVIVGWHAWPAVQVGQYGEVVVFLLIGALVGHVGGRLRTERDRARAASEQHEETLGRLRTSLEERLRVDRLVTVGRIAAGMAHEIRNPLGAARGALEILENRALSAQPRAEFTAIAQQGITRASLVLDDLLEFAQPSPPAVRHIDLRELVRQTARLTGAALSGRGLALRLAGLPEGPALVAADADQLQRVLVTLVLEGARTVEARRLHLALTGSAQDVVVWVELLDGRTADWRVDSLFEPFSDRCVGHGLTLALARRLAENQGGRVRVDALRNGVRCMLEFTRVAAAGAPGLDAGSQVEHPTTPRTGEIVAAPLDA